MIKCYFIGHPHIYDDNLDQKIAAELEKLLQLDDSIECWFYKGIASPYYKLCLELSLWLRTKYPHKSVKIVNAFDVKDDEEQIETYNLRTDGWFPRCMMDRNVYIPLPDTTTEKNFTRYADWVEQWLIKHCDYLFFYGYPHLEKKIYSQAAHIRKEATIVSLGFAETEAILKEKRAAVLSQRDRAVLTMLDEGHLDHAAIAQHFGLSKSRVVSISREVGRKLRQAMAAHISTKQPTKPSVCAILCLDNPLAADELVLFECMLEYLIRENGVREFWLDEASSQSVYRYVLEGLMNKKAGEIEITIKRCQASEYQDVIQKSQWVLTDYAQAQSETIKRLCSEDGQTLLIDLTGDKRGFETLPLE